MKKIILTQGKVALVNDEDFERLNRFKWYAKKRWNVFYAARNSPTINGKRYTIRMHHEIIGKSPKGFEVDHENGNGLNNQRYNLRFITHRQNGQNLKNTKKSSQFPGIYWQKQYQKWSVQIQVNGKKKWLGRFTDEREAFKVYKQAVESLGEKVIDYA